MKNKINWNEIERTIGGMKFAVVVIVLFTICMITGTFFESYFGTDFANRTIYKAPFFMLLQLAMFLSIIFAAFLRLPPKKRLYGFYTIHSGLVIIGIGSLITYIAGVDGQMTLPPNETTRQIVLTKDIFKITYPDEGKQLSTFLPYSYRETNMDQTYNNITLKKFLPFAEGKLNWINSIDTYPDSDPIQSSQYHYKNAFAEQDITLSLHPEASNDFPATSTMGPLSFIYLPAKIADCFKNVKASKVIFWNTKTAECFSPEEKNIVSKLTPSMKRFYAVPFNGSLLTFFPGSSPFPVDQNAQSNQSSVLRVLALELFEKKPTLFLFGKKASFYSKSDEKWHNEDFVQPNNSISLPWMGADIQLIAHETKKLPFNIPTATIPIQKNGSLIKGDLRAVQVEILGKPYWVSNYNPLSLNIQGKNVIFEVTKETLDLPFEMALTEFKMEKDPGTSMPASYESFVKLFEGSGTTNHHIFMNNPLKVKGYTLYQASYAEGDNGVFSSTLSVNVDQGRPLKYLGSLMLVFGAIWHFNLNKKKKGTSA
jgi:ABC-type transport system involved in multi-copper enzyme maturation permease subunit